MCWQYIGRVRASLCVLQGSIIMLHLNSKCKHCAGYRAFCLELKLKQMKAFQIKTVSHDPGDPIAMSFSYLKELRRSDRIEEAQMRFSPALQESPLTC